MKSSKPQFDGKKVKVKLADVCTLTMGQSPSSNSYNEIGNGIPFFQGNADFGEEAPVPRVWCTDPKKTAEGGDLLISVRAPIGAVNMAVERCCIGRGIAAIHPNDDSISVDFLKHQLLSKRRELETMGTGSTFKAVGKKSLGNLTLVLYPEDTQHEIERCLNQIKKQIKAISSQSSKLDSLVKSRFIEMFGDLKQGYSCSSCRLGSISRIGSSRRVFRNELLSEGIPFYRGTEIAALSMGSETSPSLFISKERYDELVAITGKPEVGDLLLPSICPDGQIWRVDTGKPFYFKDGRVLWIHPNREIVDSIFLRHALSILFQMSFSDIASGTTFAEMKIFLLKELEVPLPDITVQKKFAAFVAQVDKSRFGGMLHLLNSLSGIMHASFFSVADTD